VNHHIRIEGCLVKCLNFLEFKTKITNLSLTSFTNLGRNLLAHFSHEPSLAGHFVHYFDPTTPPPPLSCRRRQPETACSVFHPVRIGSRLFFITLLSHVMFFLWLSPIIRKRERSKLWVSNRDGEVLFFLVLLYIYLYRELQYVLRDMSSLWKRIVS
jgi:hypothetical protein